VIALHLLECIDGGVYHIQQACHWHSKATKSSKSPSNIYPTLLRTFCFI